LAAKEFDNYGGSLNFFLLV